MLTLTTASAGSGKTYRLAQEYIRLALDPSNVRAFASILAVTFTKKATAEIKERILSQLKEMAAGTMPLPIQSPRHTPALAARVHRAILEHYDDFTVLTLDSFFQRIIRAFALELNLPGNYRIQLDTEEVKELAVERLLGRDGTSAEIRPVLRRMVLEQLEEGGKWNVRGRIAAFADQLFKAGFARFQPALAQQHDLVDGNVLTAIRSEFKDLAQGLKAAIDSFVGLVAGMRSGGAIKLGREVGWMESRLLKEGWAFMDEPPGYLQSILEDAQDAAIYFSQAELKKQPAAAADMAADIGLALEEIIAYVRRNRRRYHTLKLLYDKLPETLLVTALAHELGQIRQERNLFMLYQQAMFLGTVTQNSSTPFIYDKIGLRLKHFLIDEMQDTSRDQWQALQPLIENSLGYGEDNLVVGDVKQAIYRWRDGDWSLMLGGIQETLPKDSVEEDRLAFNYRSLGVVVGFNNAIVENLPRLAHNAFTHSPELEALLPLVREDVLRHSAVLQEAFANGSQQLPADKPERKDKGYVRLEFFAKPSRFAKQEEDAMPAIDPIEGRLIAWLGEAFSMGYRPGDVSILVRTREQAARVAEILQQAEAGGDRRFAFSSADSLSVEQASVVRFLVAMLRVLASKRDVLSMVAAVHEYGIYIRHLAEGNPAPDPPAASRLVSELLTLEWSKDVETPSLERFFSLLPPGVGEVWPELELLGASAALQTLAGACGLAQVRDEQAYLLAFLESALTYEREHGGAITGFLSWWDQRGHRLRVDMPPTPDRIKIQTIHASKGLEYPVVMAPFADWKMDSSTHSQILWLPTGEAERYHGVALGAFAYGKPLRASDFAGQAFEEQIARNLDALNLAYVAFTRAARMLYIGAEYPSQAFRQGKALAADLGDLLHAFAQEPAAGGQPAAIDDDWAEVVPEVYVWGSPVQTEGKAVGAGEVIRPELRFPTRLRKAAPAAQAMDLHTGLMPEAEVLARLLRSSTVEGGLNEGHAQEMLSEGLVTKAAMAFHKERANALRPQLAMLWGGAGDRLLTRPILAQPDGTSISPDRILFRQDGGAVVTTFIAAGLEGAEASDARHILALSARSLADMGRPVSGAYLIYLDPFGVERIEENAPVAG